VREGFESSSESGAGEGDIEHCAIGSCVMSIKGQRMEAVDATSEAMFSYLSMVHPKLEMSHCISSMYSSGIDCLLIQLYTLLCYLYYG